MPRLASLVLTAIASAACGLMTDAATRLAQDVRDAADALRAGTAVERRIVHRPRSWPEGCGGGYTVVFQESLHHPDHGGSLLVGCAGTPNAARLGYNYATTFHLNAVRVPRELRIDKVAGAPLTLVLRKVGPGVDLVAIE